MAAVRPEGRHELTAPRTVTVDTARLLRWIDGFADRHGSFEPTVTSTEVALTARDGSIAVIEVPFPPLVGTRIADLLAHVKQQRRVGVLIVRRGGYGAGVFEGARLESSKVGSSYVQGTTKAGGSSQKRYARRRANQASHAFAEAADVAARILGETHLDALVLGGDRPAVRTVLADRRLQHLEALVTGPWLEVKDPKLRVLEATAEQFLTARIRITESDASAQ
ncbi:MAG TPA: acVLRF1 family peptidyl-tRNA hydrolase [Jatrophihabitantaceae bacterium]